MLLKSRRLFLGTIVLFAWKTHAQTPAISFKLDSLYLAAFTSGDFNGSVLVADKGQVIYQNAFGYANIESKIPNRNSTRSDLGSVSKLFTAVAILQLKEKGHLRLSDPIIKYLPDFPYAGITIRHLLTHTSGLQDFEIFDAWYQQDPHRLFLNKDVIPALKAYGKLLFTPGERWSYSSPGMALLASIVEVVSKRPFEDYLASFVFKPAGMKNTYINSLTHPCKDTGRVENYVQETFFSARLVKADTSKRHVQFSQESGALLGPGLLVSDKQYLLHFDNALYAGKLLREATMKEAFTAIKLNSGEYAHPDPFLGKTTFGLGWFILEDNPCGKMVLHTGKHGGIVTIFVRNIARHQTLVLFDNKESADLNTTALNSLNILNERPVHIRKRSLGRLYAQDLFGHGPDVALTYFNTRRSDTANFYLNIQEMDYGGHQLLSAGFLELGLETLRLLTLMEPLNAFSYYSYAKGLQEAGKKPEAILMYKKALQLNPNDKDSQTLLQSLQSE